MSSDNSGRLSKFQERLRKIRLSRIKKRVENEQFIQDKVNEIHSAIDHTPRVVGKGISIREDHIKKQVSNVQKENNLQDTNIKDKDSNTLKNNFVEKVISDIERTSSDRKVIDKKVGIDSKGNVLVGEDKNHYKDDIKNEGQVKEHNDKKVNQADAVKRNKDSNTYVTREEKRKKRVGVASDEERKEELEKLGKEILDKIQESFEDKLDELEVLEGELFLLSKEEENALVMNQIKEVKKKIDHFIEEVNQIIDQYNAYQRNYYIDHVTAIDDDVIVDDLIDYRALLDHLDDEKNFIKEYKKFESFGKLYSHLKKVQSEVKQLQDKTKNKALDIGDRDKKYQDILEGMIDVTKINKDCSEEINKQNEYFERLMKDINKIDREEYVTHHLRGLGDLVGMSLRYVGLMLLNPFRGTIPGIGLQTLATRRLIGNLYHNLHWEEVRHIHYEAVDYDSEISKLITDVDYTSVMIDDTLRDIGRLREDFMLKYDSNIPGYQDTLDKIDKIYRIISRNQNRIDKVKKNLNHSKKVNEEKLMRVRELNEQH